MEIDFYSSVGSRDSALTSQREIDAALARGVAGVPTFVAPQRSASEEVCFFGNDRLPLLRHFFASQENA